ncbi:hypothetical protein L2E82_52134 [Cichorium intybus]|nr:hypothetical protein L2E82_52134 [Cichorium intybus]
MMGILSRKKRYKHRLSIQSVFPGLPKTLLIRKRPPAIEKRSQVFVNDESRLRLEERGLGPREGFQGLGRVDYRARGLRFVHWDWAWTNLDWASIDEK